MKWLSAGLTFVNVATFCGLLLGILAQGLSRPLALLSLLVGFALGILAYQQTNKDTQTPIAPKYPERIFYWFLAACFAFFAFRSFGWLVFLDGNQIKVQSSNNLGDLALHITYIETFASGVPLWPDNPIHPFSKMRYPGGIDLFNGLLLLTGIDLTKGLVWSGLFGALATFGALYRWGGQFTVAGFLFNGGLAGLQILQTGKFLDYQGDKTVAWKSLALAMLVTQRGLLYALPAGLLLLCQWRALYRRTEEEAPPPLPRWVEISLYASMPLFHLHTFIALSLVAALLFVFGNVTVRKHLGLVVAAAVVPATFLVWTVSDRFRASSLLQWHPGWVQTKGEFAAPFFTFWLTNFGLLIPLVLILVGLCIWRRQQVRHALAFLTPAALIFLFACLVKTAPWEWDNIKLIIWAYLIMLPFLWSELIAGWPVSVRVGVCIALFASGFVSLFGGLVSQPNGYGLAERAEVDSVGAAVHKLPATARFAAYPTYNHPLLLQGRKVVLGYLGHLWTQGFDYSDLERRLTKLMQGGSDWKEEARYLGVRYIFWGREEKNNYATSTRPWEREAALVASGTWGAIYDLGATRP